jgi:hypothetical protein
VFVELEAQNRIAGELASGERLLWSGRPDSRRWFYAQDAVLVPFSLAWGSFAIFWEASVLSSRGAGGSVVNALWGVPFVAIGLYLIAGRLFARRWIRRHTLYALTDQRVISIGPSWPRGERTTSVWLGSYPPVEKRPARGGQGTLLIGSFPRANRWLASEPGWPGSRSASANAVVFADIADADEVYAKVRRQLSELPSGRTASPA